MDDFCHTYTINTLLQWKQMNFSCIYQYGCVFQNVKKKDNAAEEYMQYNIHIKYKNR